VPGFPGLTVERHLKNFRWKVPVDIAHYRDGFLKTRVSFNEASLAMSGSKRVC
jgi:adenylate cyclase